MYRKGCNGRWILLLCFRRPCLNSREQWICWLGRQKSSSLKRLPNLQLFSNFCKLFLSASTMARRIMESIWGLWKSQTIFIFFRTYHGKGASPSLAFCIELKNCINKRYLWIPNESSCKLKIWFLEKKNMSISFTFQSQEFYQFSFRNLLPITWDFTNHRIDIPFTEPNIVLIVHDC